MKSRKRQCIWQSGRNAGKGEWKEIDFTKDQLQKPCKDWLEAEGNKAEEIASKGKYHYEKKMVVKFFLKPEREKMTQWMCLSEHPFGTIKRAMGATYFLLKGMRKVAGEFALFCLGYHLERARNLLLISSIMLAAIVLFVSELFQSAVPAAVVPFLFAAVPLMGMYKPMNRTLEQIINYLPTIRVSPSTLEDYHLLQIGNTFVDCLQVSPVLYFLLAVLFLLLCWKHYQNFQITGR